jgi:two-component system, NtrC family, sensor histidine kinase HydH
MMTTPKPALTTEIQSSSSAARANRVRWTWLATTIAVAAALVVGSYLNYRGVASVAETLNRGQADVLEVAQRDAFPPRDSITSERMQQFVADHRAAGVRYFALLDTTGRIVASAGEPAGPIDASLFEGQGGPMRRSPLINVGGKLRSVHGRPPPWGWQKPDSAQQRRFDSLLKAGGAPPRFPRGYLTVLEFEPVALSLLAGARRALVLATVGALILTLATLLFWRTSRRYDDIRQKLEEQRRLTLLGEMSAVLAHEIRNPLASLKGHAQLLSERLPDLSVEKRKADRVVDEAKRLEVLTNDLLDFARSGPMDLRRVSPAELLRTCVSDLPDGMVSVDTNGAPETWFLDERRFGYGVLANLLRNAVQASPPDTPVEARAFANNGMLVYTIRDRGAGLPAGQEERLFDPFFTTRTTGTGLGLALARRVVELHGGRISARNAENGGAIFRVEIPAAS